MSMTPYKRLQVAAFLFLLLVVLFLVFKTIQPFLNMLVLAVVLSILFQPLHKKIRAHIHSPTSAALLTTGIILLIILIPMWLFGQILFNEVIDLYHNVRSGDLVINKSQILASVPDQLKGMITQFSIDFNSFVERFTSNIFQTFSQVVSNVASFILSFFLVMFTTFYFLRDGEHFKKMFMDVSPIATSQENILFHKIASAVNGVVLGRFVMALIQGGLSTVGYFIFAVPNPFLWGLFTVVASLVPTLGTALVLVPAAVFLLITGHVGFAIGLALWGGLLVGLIDNFLGPKITGGFVEMHPLLVLLSALGGIEFFGTLGFLLGPILMAVFIAMIDMYRKDFQEYIEK